MSPTDEYTSEFLAFWKLYPPRAPPDGKKEAFRCWRARLREGVAASELIDAAREYAGYCHRKGIVRTGYVLRAATFLGPNERWMAFKPKGGGAADKPDATRHNGASVTRPPDEERVDAREWIAELIRGLAKRKKSPARTGCHPHDWEVAPDGSGFRRCLVCGEQR